MATTHSPTAVNKVPPYLAINPQLFDSTEHWTYRDLQKLAKRLNLGCSGTREEVVQRLRSWHRDQRITGQAGHFHAVQVRATPEGKAISPRLLSPLQKSSARDKGILSSKRMRGDEPASPAPLSSSARGNVLFSPYNMVKLIPSKEHSEMYGQYRDPAAGGYDDGLFDDDDDL